jgi:hypothetical protein
MEFRASSLQASTPRLEGKISEVAMGQGVFEANDLEIGGTILKMRVGTQWNASLKWDKLTP